MSSSNFTDTVTFSLSHTHSVSLSYGSAYFIVSVCVKSHKFKFTLVCADTDAWKYEILQQNFYPSTDDVQKSATFNFYYKV